LTPSGSDAGKSIPGSDAPKNPAEVMPGGSSGEVRLLRRKFSQVHRPRQLRPRERSQMPSFRQSSWSESRYYCFTALPGERRTIQRSRSVSCSSDPVRPTSNLVFCDPFLNPRLSGGDRLRWGVCSLNNVLNRLACSKLNDIFTTSRYLVCDPYVCTYQQPGMNIEQPL